MRALGLCLGLAAALSGCAGGVARPPQADTVADMALPADWATPGALAATAPDAAANQAWWLRFDGPLQLEISAHPKLLIGGLHIANAPGFDGGEFASMGEAHLALDLWPLLRMRLQIEELSGSDVHIRLQLKKDGRTNWTFNPPARKQDVALQPAPEQAGMAVGDMLALLDIKRVNLSNLLPSLVLSVALALLFG